MLFLTKSDKVKNFDVISNFNFDFKWPYKFKTNNSGGANAKLTKDSGYKNYKKELSKKLRKQNSIVGN